MKISTSFKGIFTAIVAAALLFPSPVRAQEGQGVIVDIPFEFSVSQSHLYAGSYLFSLSADRFGMWVTNLETGKKQYVTVSPQGDPVASESGFAVFSRAGAGASLSEVHFPGATGSSRLNIGQGSKRDRNTILIGAVRR
ncbi:MAG TPA: hypothetical protein VGG95_09805 [Edaphobacter sp.]